MCVKVYIEYIICNQQYIVGVLDCWWLQFALFSILTRDAYENRDWLAVFPLAVVKNLYRIPRVGWHLKPWLTLTYIYIIYMLHCILLCTSIHSVHILYVSNYPLYSTLMVTNPRALTGRTMTCRTCRRARKVEMLPRCLRPWLKSRWGVVITDRDIKES